MNKLDKETPMQVIIETVVQDYGGDDKEVMLCGTCPRCNRVFDLVSDEQMGQKEFQYCPNCGQKLKWRI